MHHRVLGDCAALLIIAVISSVCGSALPVSAASSETGKRTVAAVRAAYRQALAQERALRTRGPAPADVTDFRTVISTYRNIAEKFATSTYADWALWQASGLCLAAFEHAHDHLDRDTGIELLHQLRRDYPTGHLTLRVDERLKRFSALETHRWITALRRDVLGEVIRVTLELDGEPAFKSERLVNPARIFFDLPETAVAPAVAQHVSTMDHTLIGGVRYGQHPNNMTRVVLNTVGAKTCHVFTLYEPFRIVTNCRATQSPVATPTSNITPVTDPVLPNHNVAPIAISKPVTVLPFPEPLSVPVSDTPSIQTALPRQLGLGISRIVIDPGHGGRDPGAIGHALKESIIVLDIANRVSKRLTQYGIETVMTRRVDRYLSLKARTELANRVRADLFLSIHANSGDRPDARGVETYVLDFAKSREAAAVATRENALATGTMVELDPLVRAISTSAKAEESLALAELVQQRLVGKLRTVDPGIPNLGVKEAPFVVLIGTRVPSVLTEISFVSNEHDARLLGTDTYRDLIADGLVEAVLGYRHGLKPTSSIVPTLTATDID